MWLAAGYFDESTDETEDRCYTVAGYISNGQDGLLLDFHWKDLLDKWNMPFFKASEIEFGFGAFAQYRDDPKQLSLPLSKREKELIRKIKTSFVDLLCEHDGITGMAAILNLREYQIFKMEEPYLAKRITAPYRLCSHFMMMEAGQEMLAYNQRHPNTLLQGLMRPVFDSHEDYSFHFKQSFPEFCRKNPESSRYLLPPIYEKEQTYRCLQAADCLAYEARRLVDNSFVDPSRPERAAMTKLRQTVSKIYFIGYDGLKVIAEAQEAEQIPIAPSWERGNK